MPTHRPELRGIAADVWQRKYRFAGSKNRSADTSFDDTAWRVAKAAARAEKSGKRSRAMWAKRFHAAIADFGFVPAGRILAGAGTHRRVTLFNCFVLDTIPDDLGGIFDAVKDAALTMQAGGGIGHDFSTLRPRGARVASIAADAAGPVHFMNVWDAMCATIQSAGQRRGAMMATLRCDHPDIQRFVAAKRDPKQLRNFNLSVLVTDHFMDCVSKDAPWPLVFAGQTYETISARGLWDQIMQATYDYAEPGVIFIDRVNARNNLGYCETISATNPCGEQPLPANGACLLGSINLAALVQHSFTANSGISDDELRRRVSVAVRFLDNIIDVSKFPLKAQKAEALAKRRIGLGLTGLADALIFCGLNYGSDAGRRQAAHWMQIIQNAAYRASAQLAKEKGTFPLYDKAGIALSRNLEALDEDVRADVARHGLRNGCLTSIAPTGTISLLAGNVSSGIEPVFDLSYNRRVTSNGDAVRTQQVEDFAFARYRATFAQTEALPAAFVTAETLQPAEHLAMQAALQPYVDSAISKTINCAEDIAFDDFKSIYTDAYRLGLKGCTTYRPNDITGSILSKSDASLPVDTNASVTASATTTETDVHADTAVSAPRQAEEDSAALAAPQHRDDIVYMSEPLARDQALAGITYKIKWPASAHAIYVTINDMERHGRRRPFEIFINTKNLEHYAWTVALTRMISAVFRRGGDVAFVAEELKAVFDPEGGQWVKGRYVPSLLAAIGDVIEAHMRHIGFIIDDTAAQNSTHDVDSRDVHSREVKAAVQRRENHAARPNITQRVHAEAVTARHRAPFCPQCGERGLRRIEGCWTCPHCQYSRCS